jgi:YjbE family integral membrane protein
VNELLAVVAVVLIDVTLAADNAVIVGLAASRVAPELRTKAVFWGILGAVCLRLVFARFATQIISIIGLKLAGGLLLLWVCWKMFRELRETGTDHGSTGSYGSQMGLGRAIAHMIVADVSMSLDNVLAIAGAARGSTVVLVVGVTISVMLMAIASNLVAKLLSRVPWIAWVGLAVVVFVACDMIWRGFFEIEPHVLR